MLAAAFGTGSNEAKTSSTGRPSAASHGPLRHPRRHRRDLVAAPGERVDPLVRQHPLGRRDRLPDLDVRGPAGLDELPGPADARRSALRSARVRRSTRRRARPERPRPTRPSSTNQRKRSSVRASASSVGALARGRRQRARPARRGAGSLACRRAPAAAPSPLRRPALPVQPGGLRRRGRRGPAAAAGPGGHDSSLRAGGACRAGVDHGGRRVDERRDRRRAV